MDTFADLAESVWAGDRDIESVIETAYDMGVRDAQGGPKPSTAYEGETFTDFLGQTVSVGDHVVYATTSGKSPVQKLAVVVKITNETRERMVNWTKRETQEYVHSKVGVREIKNGRGFTRFDSYEYQKDENGDYVKAEGGGLVRIPKNVRTTYPMSDNMVKVQFEG